MTCEDAEHDGANALGKGDQAQADGAAAAGRPSGGQPQAADVPVADEGAVMMSISLTLVAFALAMGLELAVTHGQHRTVALGWIFEGYAVFFGAPAFLKSLVDTPSDEVASAARHRRLKVSGWLRAPWRRGAVLRRIASWLLMTAFIWVLASEHFHRWMIPPIIIVFAIILGLTIGVAGWIAIVVPELWVKPPTDERVTTLRGLISHPKAASIGGATAALFAVAGVALHLLDLYAVWRF